MEQKQFESIISLLEDIKDEMESVTLNTLGTNDLLKKILDAIEDED